jgi:hypothetical protein
MRCWDDIYELQKHFKLVCVSNLFPHITKLSVLLNDEFFQNNIIQNNKLLSKNCYVKFSTFFFLLLNRVIENSICMLHNPDLKMVMFENFLNINNFIKSQQEFLIEKVEFDFNIILQYMDKSIAMYINTVFLMLSYSILESKLIWIRCQCYPRLHRKLSASIWKLSRICRNILVLSTNFKNAIWSILILCKM